MKKTPVFFLFGFLFWFSFCFTPAEAVDQESFAIRHGAYRISYETLELPGSESMSLTGMHVLIDFAPSWYMGAGGFGAVSGNRGGFFTGGLEAGGRWNLGHGLAADAGLFAGGGGGAGAPQGGGLMIRPYAGLWYDLGTIRAGVQFAHVDFHSGSISSSHLSFLFEVPFDALLLGNETPDFLSNIAGKPLLIQGRSVGFSRHYLSPMYQFYVPLTHVRNRDNRTKTESIGMIGIEYGRFSSRRSSVFLEAAGAMTGSADGFAEIFIGTEYRLPLLVSEDIRSRLFLSGRIKAGAAGGGNVDTGGGIVFKTMLGMKYHLNSQFAAGLSGGYVAALEGDFKAKAASADLAYLTDFAVFDKKGSMRMPGALSVNKWRIGPGWETYLARVPRKNNTSNPLSLIGLTGEKALNPTFSITGHARAAYEGLAGGYAIGLLGLKLATSPLLASPAHLFIEAAAGAAGGGGIQVGGGFVVQTTAGVRYDFPNGIGIETSYGKIQAVEDGLNSNTIQVGIRYAFSTLNRKISYFD